MRAYEKISVERDGDVAVIRLNDPASLNAIGAAMGAELADALERADGAARAILLTSAGRAFSSGANLADGGVDASAGDLDMGAYLETLYNPLIRRLRDLSAPLVVAVKGAAAGVGCSVALTGDVIVCSRSAYFLQAFCNLGLVPDGGSPWLLARAIGRVRAMEMMLLGERYPAERAYADGLITRVVDDADVDATALDFARRLAAGPTKAYALIRKSAWAALDGPLDAQLDLERALQRDAGRTKDFVEGISAFWQKRKPTFTGE